MLLVNYLIDYSPRYKLGAKTGKGQFSWSDGATYDGEFNENEIHGEGAYVWADGRKYVGLLAQGLSRNGGTK